MPLYGITDKGINWLMGSNLSKLTSPKFFFYTVFILKLIRLLLSVGYSNQFVSSFNCTKLQTVHKNKTFKVHLTVVFKMNLSKNVLETVYFSLSTFLFLCVTLCFVSKFHHIIVPWRKIFENEN